METIETDEVVLLEAKQTEDKIVLIQAQDTTPILRHNFEHKQRSKRWRPEKKGAIGDYLGRVPELVYNDWVRNGLVYDKKSLNFMLNMNPQYKATKKIL